MAQINIQLDHQEILLAIIEYTNSHYNLEPLYENAKAEHNVKLTTHGNAVSAVMKCKV